MMPAVPVVPGLAGRVDPHHRLERATVRGHRDLAQHRPRIHRLDQGTSPARSQQSMTTLEPGASVVFTQGLRDRPLVVLC